MYTVFLLIFFLVVLIQIAYYGILFSRFAIFKKEAEKSQLHPISLIIACKNEKENLEENLPIILAQQYPKFEIVLVDDASTDGTLSIMESFAKQHENVHVISIPKTNTYTGNKKNALTLAIQKAQYEHLLFTDADCKPKTTFWIEKMSSQFSDKKQLVLGYGAYQKQKTWLNKLIRYETLMTAIQYFSYAKIGLPYMGVGRNIAYTKSLFEKAKGFQKHQNIKSGDDDLFVNQVGNKENMALCWQSDSHTISLPKTTLSDWLHQKRRHIATATSYKPIHQILLGLFYSSQLLFYLLLIILVFSGIKTVFVLSLIAIRYVFYYFAVIVSSKKLNEKDLIIFAPLLEFCLLVIQLCIFIKNFIHKPTHW